MVWQFHFIGTFDSQHFTFFFNVDIGESIKMCDATIVAHNKVSVSSFYVTVFRCLERCECEYNQFYFLNFLHLHNRIIIISCCCCFSPHFRHYWQLYHHISPLWSSWFNTIRCGFPSNIFKCHLKHTCQHFIIYSTYPFSAFVFYFS